MTDMRFPPFQKIDAQSKKTPYFLLHFCVVSPPALHRRDLAFELFALLILSLFLFFIFIYCPAVPRLLDQFFGSFPPLLLFLLPYPQYP